MPLAPLRRCSWPRCFALVRGGTRCDAHRRGPWAGRPSPQTRGYDYRWTKIRKQVLAEEPACRYCKRAPSTQVDHIVPRFRGGDDTRGNLAGVCSACHASKTGPEGQMSRR